MSKVLTRGEVNKARTARHLLPSPGPEVVGDFILTITRLYEYVKHKDGCRMAHAAPDEGSTCICGLAELLDAT